MLSKEMRSLEKQLKKGVRVDGDHWLWEGKEVLQTCGWYLRPMAASWKLYRQERINGELVQTCMTPHCIAPTHLELIPTRR